MSFYRYVARDTATGKSVQGRVEAESQTDAVRALRAQGMIPTQLAEDNAPPPSGASGGSSASAASSAISMQDQAPSGSFGRKKRRLKSGTPKMEDLVIIFRQLSTMIRAGLPLVEALNTLTEQADKKLLAVALGQIERDVQAGSSFHESMARHPKVFNTFVLSMIKAGEASGQLDGILDQVAIYMEKNAKIVRDIKSASMYPAGVVFFCGIIMFVIMTTLVPVFEQVFADMGENLPLLTQIVVAISYACRNYWWMVLGSVLMAFFAFAKWKKTPRGRWLHDYYILKLPVLGDLYHKVAIARFTRALGTLMRSGVNILSALEITAQSAGNVTIEAAILKTRTAIQGGETISRPLAESGMFPLMVTRMIEVGERTGALESMLQKVAEYYEDQVDAAVAGLTKMIEPMLIIFLGCTVGSVVISMFLPLFKMLENISGS